MLQVKSHRVLILPLGDEIGFDDKIDTELQLDTVYGVGEVGLEVVQRYFCVELVWSGK